MTPTKNRLRGEGLAHPKKMSLRLLDAMLAAAQLALASAALAVVLHLAGRVLS